MEELHKISILAPKWKILAVFAFLFVISSANPPRDQRRDVSEALLQNQTIVENINATREFMKRAGEFASRALWVRKGKFVFPTGTILSLAPKITVPAFRQKPWKGGLNSDIQATWFLYINCDKMGWTYDMHPFPFDRPPFYPFGPLMRPIASKDGDDNKDKEKEKKPESKHPMGPPHKHPDKNGYGGHGGDPESYKAAQGDTVSYFFPIQKRTEQQNQPSHGARRPRSIMSLPPPENIHGGERALILPSIENMMANFGFDGRGCMLRAICEIHEFPLQEGYGLFGEMIGLFFSVSRSPYAESHMPEYLKAEDAGRAGNCAEYRKLCAKSVFKWEVEKKKHNDVETNEVLPVSLRSKLVDDEL